jgi:DNA-binding IclR family transcriptional regulator
MPVMPSPSVVRAARLLAELAANPTEEVTLSELARRLQINKTSCQGLLLGLVKEGLVTRGSNRTYRLGSKLIHLGEAAKASLRLPELVAPELAALTLDLAVTSIAGVKAGAEIVLVAVNEVLDPTGFSIRLGQRLPLWAPLGPVYLAWGAPNEVEAWLDRAHPPLTNGDRARARHVIDVVRARGCSITVRHPDGPSTAGGTGDPDQPGSVTLRSPMSGMEYPDEVDPSMTWNVLGISSPVFGFDGQMFCSIAVGALPFQIDHAEVMRVADRVCAAAAAVTAELKQHL